MTTTLIATLVVLFSVMEFDPVEAGRRSRCGHSTVICANPRNEGTLFVTECLECKCGSGGSVHCKPNHPDKCVRFTTCAEDLAHIGTHLSRSKRQDYSGNHMINEPPTFSLMHLMKRQVAPHYGNMNLPLPDSIDFNKRQGVAPHYGNMNVPLPDSIDFNKRQLPEMGSSLPYKRGLPPNTGRSRYERELRQAPDYISNGRHF